MIIFLVKPPPPEKIQKSDTPIPEANKYNWEPINLRLIADHLEKVFGTKIQVELWHLFESREIPDFLDAVASQKPAVVAFTEIDILVSRVNMLNTQIKKILPQCKIIVGGKHSSLLREGDPIPFVDADFLVSGDGQAPVESILHHLLEQIPLSEMSGLLDLKVHQVVPSNFKPSPKILPSYDIARMRGRPIHGHPIQDYICAMKPQPSTVSGEIRWASIITSLGCPFQCHFCQSPLEGPEVLYRPIENIVDELDWLGSQFGINSYFSLAPNLDLEQTYLALQEFRKRSQREICFSGFVRAGDIMLAENKGFLRDLSSLGLRIISLGLDISPSRGDIYGKGFSKASMLENLEACRKNGILVSGTFIVDPRYTVEELETSLEEVTRLPIATLEVRIAMALKNTMYHNQLRNYSIQEIDNDLDKHNYRYQTLQSVSGSSPEQTYAVIRKAYQEFPMTSEHIDYMDKMAKENPYTIPFFERQKRKA